MKTRTSILIVLTITSSLLLASCSSAATATLTSEQSLPLAPTLAVGILQLEDTDQAVTSAQASELLTYWQAYQVLSDSETTAQEELEALVVQIQGVLTDDQQQAIEAMQLSSDSVAELTQSLAAAQEITSTAGSDGASAADTTFPGGPGGMGGGPGGMAGDEMSVLMEGSGAELPTQSQPDGSMPAQQSAQSATISPVLLDALISMLQARMQAAS